MKGGLAALALSAFFILPSLQASGAPSTQVTVSLPGYPPRYSGSSQLMVVGLWHEVNVEAGDQSNIELTLHYGYSLPSNGSDATLYRFNYSSGTFSDALYGHWLDGANCSAAAGVFKFRVALNTSARSGPWTLLVNGSGARLAEAALEMEGARPELALSSPDFYFRLEPNTPGNYLPMGGQYFRTSNTGNVPLGLSLEFDNLGSHFSATNITQLGIGGDVEHYLSLQAPAWEPGSTTVRCTLRGTPLQLAIRDPLGLEVAIAVQFKIAVQMGRGGFTIDDSGAFVLQYPPTLSSNSSKSVQFDVYLSGKTDTEFSLSALNATILSVRRAGSPVSLPLRLNLSGQGEVPLNITLKPLKGRTSASVTYSIRTVDGTTSRNYTTGISVAAAPATPPVEPEPDRTLPILFLVVAAVLGISIALYTYRGRGKGHRPESSDDEAGPDEETANERRRSRRRLRK